MKRRSWTAKRKLAVFLDHGGQCHICGGKIDGVRERWELEHIIPVAMGGADDETNAAPAHESCHAGKTKADVAQIAKANRVRAKHNGVKTSKAVIPGSKASRYKRKVNGTTVLR
jgi:5-methylcytosine-specific restriction endonuclease McrA